MLVCLAPFMMGCGGGKGKISGSVNLDGKPLPAGTITFYPAKGTPVTGNISDGQYSVSGVASGNAKVAVETASLKKEMENLRGIGQGMAQSMSGMPPGAKIPPEAQARIDEEKKKAQDAAQKVKELQAKYRPIPDKYAKSDTSGLTYDVKSGGNTWDVPLSSK